MGRNPKSSERHALQGTKPHATTVTAVSEVKSARPKMPKTLTPAAKKEWRRIVPILEERGTLSRADSTCLSLYAETYARWLQAQEELATHGLVVVTTVLDKHGAAIESRKANPALKISESAERSLRAFLREFGCTPQSREKIKPTRKVEEQTESILDFLTKQAESKS
jgi:P27 family predicted phage terminase small subunit